MIIGRRVRVDRYGNEIREEKYKLGLEVDLMSNGDEHSIESDDELSSSYDLERLESMIELFDPERPMQNKNFKSFKF